MSGLRRPHAGHSPLVMVICVRDRGDHWPPMSLGHLAPRHRVTSTGARGQTEGSGSAKKNVAPSEAVPCFVVHSSSRVVHFHLLHVTILLTLTLRTKTLHGLQISEMIFGGFKYVKLYKF